MVSCRRWARLQVAGGACPLVTENDSQLGRCFSHWYRVSGSSGRDCRWKTRGRVPPYQVMPGDGRSSRLGDAVNSERRLKPDEPRYGLLGVEPLDPVRSNDNDGRIGCHGRQLWCCSLRRLWRWWLHLLLILHCELLVSYLTFSDG